MSGQFVPYSGNRPNPQSNDLPSTVSPAHSLSGHGSPEGVVPGNPGMLWNDLDTGDLWIKEAGTGKVGWYLRGVSGVAGVQVIG